MTQYLHYEDIHGKIYDSTASRVNKALEVLEKCREDVKLLTNDQLFEDYSDLLHGDDWDGCHTLGGKQAMQALTEEITARLRASGFLSS